MTHFRKFAPLLFLVVLAWPQPSSAQRAQYEAMVASQALANCVPGELVHRVIMRESRYNQRAVHRGESRPIAGSTRGAG